MNASSASASLVIVLILCGVVWAPIAAGQDQRRTQVTPALSQSVYEVLQTAQELAAEGQFGKALDQVRGLFASKLTPYETAQAWNFTAYLNFQQERYDEAIKAYENVLAQSAVPQALILSTLRTLSQLYFTVEQYAEAIATARRYLQLVDEPEPNMLILIGQAHYQLKEYRQALGPIREAVAWTEQQKEKPKENWLLLLRVIYHELEDYPNMLAALRQLLRYYPKDQYLLTLAAVHGQMGEPRKQLAVLEALDDADRLTQPRLIRNLVNLYLAQEIPYKAARLMDRAIEAGRLEADAENLRLLSQAWYQAREDERAIAPLARAAELATDGELYLRLAQAYTNLHRWDDAAAALRAALAAGNLDDPEKAELMMGMALFNLQRYDAARQAFARARAHEPTRELAERWLEYLDSEVRRREALTSDPTPAQPPSAAQSS